MDSIYLHPTISKVLLINAKPLFPISWLHKQEFCEYQIFLESFKGVKVEPTGAMVEGEKEHQRLFSEFEKEAIPCTLGQMIEQSKTNLWRAIRF